MVEVYLLLNIVFGKRNEQNNCDKEGKMNEFDIAITAHDSKKKELLILIEKYLEGLKELSLVATEDTGIMIRQATGLKVHLLRNGYSGGYLDMGKLVANGQVPMVFFLQDPLMIGMDDLGIRLLLTACSVNNIPFASNLITADFILHRHLETTAMTRQRYVEQYNSMNLHIPYANGERYTMSPELTITG
jgi:methylglyoxal synthase